MPLPPTQDVNILLRGQSNAGYFDLLHGAQDMVARVQALLRARGVPGTVRLLGGLNKTEFSGAGFTIADDRAWLDGAPGPDWSPGWREQALLDYLSALPPDIRRAPTITLWLHNETDELNPDLTPHVWTSAVRQDAAWVRARLGQGAATTPYYFAWVPFYVPWDSALDRRAQMIKQGMAELAADASFHAVLGPQTGDLDMNGTGDAMHMSRADADLLAARLARHLAALALRLKGDPRGAAAIEPPVFAATAAQAVGAGAVDVAVSGPIAVPLSVAAAHGAGWSLVAPGGGITAARSAAAVGPAALHISFGTAIPGGARLLYGYGHGRIAAPGGGPGQGAAIYGPDGVALTAPWDGLALAR